MNTQQFENEQGSYPVSTRTFSILQDELKTAFEAIARLVGERYLVLREPTADGSYQDGLCIFDYEVMPLTGNPNSNYYQKGIHLNTTTEDIVANGQTYAGARTFHSASYTGGAGTNGVIAIGNFGSNQAASSGAASLHAVGQQIDRLDGRIDTACLVGEMCRLYRPMSSLWDAERKSLLTFEDLPDKFLPVGFARVCDYFTTTEEADDAIDTYVSKVQAAYGSITYERYTYTVATNRITGLVRIKTITVSGRVITFPTGAPYDETAEIGTADRVRSIIKNFIRVA